ASARINIRFNPLHDSAKMAAWVRSVAARHAGDFSLEVRVTGEAFLTQPGAFTALVAEAVSEITGRRPELSTTGGTSDARFIKDLCPVAEFGTTGKTAHMVDERVKVEDLLLLTRCYEAIVKRFLCQDDASGAER
ncbi:MAG: M20/M25/M40 family metallo-hydrolase, partial [Alphaproteobacteria bacterium]|nr:M20/M25/M40 family metallo-hydrolase [Alphaproteobacteria bacterium]